MDRASLFEWPNRIALAAFLFTFAKGIFAGNAFGGFAFGIGSGFMMWVITLAFVMSFRLIQGPPRADSVPPSPPRETSETMTSPYLLALRELEQECPDEATLAEAYAVSDGDPDRTRAAYLRLRAQQLSNS